jgi:hypothetical protein
LDRIERGALSQRHLLAAQNNQFDKGSQSLLHPLRRVSIVYRGLEGRYETLDLAIANEHDCATLCRAVQDLLDLQATEATTFSSQAKSLHDAWAEVLVGKEWQAPINESEFLKICERLQVPRARGLLSGMFRDECKGVNGYDGCLASEHVAQLLRKALTVRHDSDSCSSNVRIENEALEQLWESLVDSDPIPAVLRARPMVLGELGLRHQREDTISAVRFHEFLQSQTDYMPLQDAINLVQAWNRPASNHVDDPEQTLEFSLHQDRLMKSSFFAYLTSDSNDVMNPERAKVGSDDMDKPLHHYYISTSHDTYLKKLPSSFRKLAYPDPESYEAVDEQAYAAALLRGVRCIELVVWDGLDGANPVVARRRPTNAMHHRLAFAVVIRVVRQFLETHPDAFPVLLKVENHASTVVQEKMAHILHKQLESTGLLSKPPAARSMADRTFELPSPSSLKGKVLILGKRTKLNNNTVWNDDFDSQIESYDSLRRLREYPRSNDEEEAFEDDDIIVVGFDERGPICVSSSVTDCKSPLVNVRTQKNIIRRHTVADLVHVAQYEAEASKSEVKRAESRARNLRKEADDLEVKTARCAIASGWTVEEIEAHATEFLSEELFECTEERAISEGTDGGSQSEEIREARQWSPHRGLFTHKEEEEGDLDYSKTNGEANQSTECDQPSKEDFILAERTENARLCARKIERLLRSMRIKAAAKTVPVYSLTSPQAVVDQLDENDTATENAFLHDPAFESFLDERSRTRQRQSESLFENSVDERVLARDLLSQLDEQQTGDNKENNAQSTDDQNGGVMCLGKSVDVRYHLNQGDGQLNPLVGGFQVLAGREASNMYLRSVKTRQDAVVAEENLKVLREKACKKEKALQHALSYRTTMMKLTMVPIELSRLTYFHSSFHSNWEKSMMLSSFHFHSFSHNVLLSMLCQSPIETRKKMLAFTKRHLCRVFWPWENVASSRQSNTDPVLAWSLGCQLVSCNLHSADEYLTVADGLFRQNGNCGYVLKPPHLRDNISQPPRPQKWSFRILSGHHLPPPRDVKAAGVSSPLVKTCVYSGSEVETRVVIRTRPVRHAGLNHVIWNAPVYELTLNAGSLISFGVWHRMENGVEVFMGASVIPVACLREGYRSVALLDEDHVRAGASSLLIHALRHY